MSSTPSQATITSEFLTTKVFFSYAHEDEDFRDRLATHLRLLERNGKIECWHDRKITPGATWKDEIDAHLLKADVILALVSSDYLNSDYCFEKELQTALEQHKYHRSILIPVILRSCLWSESPLGELEALPIDAKPVASWEDSDEAWKNVTEGILQAAEKILKQKTVFRDTVFEGCEEFIKERSDFLSDSRIDRNLSRLASQDEVSAKQITDYRQKLETFAAAFESKVAELYEILFSRAVVLAGMVVSGAMSEIFQEQGNCLMDELKIVMNLREAGLKSTLFGLPSTSEILQEQREVMNRQFKSIEGLSGALKGFGKSVLKPVREIGERETGEEYEDED